MGSNFINFLPSEILHPNGRLGNIVNIENNCETGLIQLVLMDEMTTRKPYFSVLIVFLAVIISGCAEKSKQQGFSMSPIGTYETGSVNRNAAEISAYDPTTSLLYILRSDLNAYAIVDMSNPAAMTDIALVDLSAFGGSPNSIDVHNGKLAVAIEAESAQDIGAVVFFDSNGRFLARYPAGAMPDMLTFSPDGSKVLVANEGSPDDAYIVDPEGSITIVDISFGVEFAEVAHVGFTQLPIGEDVRIFGPNATPAQDLEPEYIAISSDGQTAFVTLQENNALAIIEIPSRRVTSVVSLGFKDFSMPENAIDINDKDGGINLKTYPIWGMYQPDAIAAFSINSETFLLTANEGDAREYDGWSEVIRVEDLDLDPAVYNQATANALWRLKTTSTLGDADGDGLIEQIYTFGARSFSIWDENGKLIWDSGNQFAVFFAENEPLLFNSQGTYETFDSRSDEKGSEPEAIVAGVIGETTYAFIGLERNGGIMVYDVTNPHSPDFVGWYHNTNFTGSINDGTAGDVSPEGLVFVPEKDSPTEKPLLIVSHEVSGTVTVYEITP